MKALRLRIYQPTAHYRVPFTFNRRHTYPLPPYSTVVGLMCNLMGIRNDTGKGEPDSEEYNRLKGVKMSIAGRFRSKTTQKSWLRNLNKDAHVNRFHSADNRSINQRPEHIGGQSPVTIDELEDVKLIIHLAHDESSFLEYLKGVLENPKDRLTSIHLGRAEDQVIFEEIGWAELKRKELLGNYQHFFWIPAEDGEPPLGIRYELPTFYSLTEGYRNFEYVPVWLNEGKIVGYPGVTDPGVKLKNEINQKRVPEEFPVFLTPLSCQEDKT
jgi:CRISPR-associated protein Cas5t